MHDLRRQKTETKLVVWKLETANAKGKMQDHFATSSSMGTLFQGSSSPFPWRGGNENTLTVELPLLISFNTRRADKVLFMYKLSMYSISASSLGPRSRILFSEVAGAAPLFVVLVDGSCSSATTVADGISLTGNRWSSILSHSFTSLYSKSVVKNGCCKTFWMKGKRSRAPVLLSYFFNIFTNPIQS